MLKDKQYENQTIAAQTYSTEEDDSQDTYEEVDDISITQTTTGTAHYVCGKRTIESLNTTAAGVQEPSSKRKECPVTETTETILPKRVSSDKKWKVFSIKTLMVIIALVVASVTVLIMTTASKVLPGNGLKCLHMGTCSTVGDKAICNCQTGYYGDRCQFTPCTNVTCLNEGQCIVWNDNYTCICTEGYSGEACQDDPCTRSPCLNQGTCTSRGARYECSCRNRYFGDRCENYDCSRFPCVNQGTCMLRDGRYGCSCRNGYIGESCEKPVECAYISNADDGVYNIWLNRVNAVLVYCIKGWTVIQRRYNGSINFERNWNDYKKGFGTPYGEYWLGNDNIHLISTNTQHDISVYIVTAEGTGLYANYSTFSIGSASTKYTLTIGGYSGNAGDAINYPGFDLNGQQFTTRDQDNDEFGNNCAVKFKGGWWFNSCMAAHLNGLYGDRYFHWYPHYQLNQSIMMIRRQ